IIPLAGAGTVGVLWMNLEESSLVLGLTWAIIGVVYMAFLTRRFRQPLPQYEGNI
ncbi:MAG: Putrescine importer PuuP, partial [Plesiomonas sp.]